jgi:hypothetical protein
MFWKTLRRLFFLVLLLVGISFGNELVLRNKSITSEQITSEKYHPQKLRVRKVLPNKSVRAPASAGPALSVLTETTAGPEINDLRAEDFSDEKIVNSDRKKDYSPGFTERILNRYFKAPEQISLLEKSNDSKGQVSGPNFYVGSGSVASTVSESSEDSSPASSTPSNYTLLKVEAVNGKLRLSGVNLDRISSVSLKYGGSTTNFQAVSVSSSEFLAEGLSALSLAVGKVYDLIISDAHGTDTYAVSVELEDGSITPEKLAPLTSTEDGYVLKWNGGLNQWAYATDASGGGGGTGQWDDVLGGISYSAGIVGVGTNAPEATLDVLGHTQIRKLNDDAKLYLRRQDTSIIDGNELGRIIFAGDDASAPKTPGVYLSAFATQNWTAGNAASSFAISTTPAASEVPLQRVVVRDNGNVYMTMNGGSVGIGTSSPGRKLHVTSTNDVALKLDTTNAAHSGIEIFQNGAYKWAIYNPGGSSDLRFYDGTASRLTVKSGGNVGIGLTNPTYNLHVLGTAGATVAYFSDGAQSCSITPSVSGNISCTSDRRMKKNIKSYSDLRSLEKILNLETVTYEWKNGDHGVHTGYIAQDVEKVVPEIVQETKEGQKQVSYPGLIPLITGALKELNNKIENLRVASREPHREEIEELKAQNASLKKENEEIKKRLEKLEKSIQ